MACCRTRFPSSVIIIIWPKVLVLGLRLVDELDGLIPRHPREVPKDLFGRRLQVLEEYGPGLLRQGTMAEDAGFVCVQTPLPRVVILAGEAFVEVEALLALGATLEQVEFAQLHDLGRLCIVGVHTVVRVLEKAKRKENNI